MIILLCSSSFEISLASDYDTDLNKNSSSSSNRNSIEYKCIQDIKPTNIIYYL